MAQFPVSPIELPAEEPSSHHRLVRRIRILLVVCILFLIGMGTYAYHEITETAVDGPLYRNLMTQQQLVADIKPSPLYLVDCQLAVHECLDPANKDQMQRFEQRVDTLEQRYHTELIHWLSQIDKDSLSAQMLQESAEPAREFFQLTKAQLFPLLREGKYPQAQQLVQGQLDSCFRRNRAAVFRLLTHLEKETDRLHGEAKRGRASVLLMGFFVLSIAVLAVVLGPVSHAFQSESQSNLNRATAMLKQRELAVQELERYRKTINRAVIVAETDLAGRIIFANDLFVQISGYSREELIGQHHRIVNSGHHPRTFWSRMWQTIGRGEVWHDEVCNRNKNGQLYWVDTVIIPMQDDRGRNTSYIAIRSDITRRKQAEEALALSERKSRAVFDQAYQFIGLLDTQGTLLEANQTSLEFAGISVESVIGKPFWETPWWTHSSRLQARLKAGIHQAVQGQSVQFDATHVSKDNELRTIAFSLKPVKNEEGQVVWLIHEGHDITDLRHRAEELRITKEIADNANRVKSEFLANMSHEIRTPLTAIVGFADLLVNDAAHQHDETLRNGAAMAIHRSGEHLLGIINDVLDLSKIEAGQLTVEQIACSPKAILEDVSSLLKARAESKGVAFLLEYATPLPEWIKSDALRLRQILMNLCGNAIKFTERGSVRLIAEVVPGTPKQLQFDVVDSGVGMTPEQQQPLFQPFSQADASVSRRFGGTGLGLSISRKLAHMLDGEVSLVESIIDVGSRFRLTLNVADIASEQDESAWPTTGAAPRAAVAESLEEMIAQLQGVRVLLAEDGPDNQRLISFILKKVGVVVSVVENGQQAFEAALQAWSEGTPFDVILMDMQMPILDGYCATTQLRSAGYRRPIVALTANAMSGDREKCLAAGCDDFATKPIDRKALLGTIRAQCILAESMQCLPTPAANETT